MILMKPINFIRVSLKMDKIVRNITVVAFFLGVIYILFIETRLYESSSATMVKNLNDTTTDISGLGVFMGSVSSVTQDAMILQTYLSSYDELDNLDKKFHLYKHYHSDALDFADRLYSFNSREDFLNKYLSRLQLYLDETTGILTIGFLHTDANISKAITEQLLRDSEIKINEYNKLVAKKRLAYLIKQVKKDKAKLDKSIRDLERFQNRYNLLDPLSSAQSQTALISKLKSELIQKESELNSLKKYMSEKSFEVIQLKSEIRDIKRTLASMRKSLANKGKGALNNILFRYDRLKSIVDLNKEVYKTALVQLEQTKAEVSQNPKVLMRITEPYIADDYAYPQKIRSIFMLFLMLSLGYGVFKLIYSIIKEH